VFVLFFKGLGDAPARNYCEQPGSGKCTPGKLASIEHGMGTDRCVFANYGTWVRGRRTW
jgi:peptide/nickel transport system permease protein